MKISSAFAWTKGNFIESRLADECIKQGFSFRKSKAGLTWDYLQFVHNDSRRLFLVKNAAYFNESCFSQAKFPGQHGKKGGTRTYLHELSKVNKSVVFPAKEPAVTVQELPLQLPLFVSYQYAMEELQSIASTYNEFHILTYTLDDAFQIAEIMHYMPNPIDNIAYLIEDLSDLIAGAELTEEDREVLAPDTAGELLEPEAYDIGIIEDDLTARNT